MDYRLPVILNILRFCSNSYIVTSKKCWCQIRSATIRSKVMGNLSSKIWNNKADVPGGKQRKIMMVTKDPFPRCKLRKVKKKLSKKCDLRLKTLRTTESPKMTFLYFSKRMNFPAREAFFSLRGPVIILPQPRRRRAFLSQLETYVK